MGTACAAATRETGGELQLMALMGYDAITLGNHGASRQTNVQAIWTNIAAIAAGGDLSLAIGNRLPTASGQAIYANANRDRLTTLSGFDLDNDPLIYRITSLPTKGALYQYATNGRGAAILAADTVLTDPNRRVYFAPPPDNFSVFPQFKFRVSDGLADSLEATVSFTIYPPPAPNITSIGPGSNNTVQVVFTGDANTSHCVWISTNLATWQYFGQATQIASGQFLFVGMARWSQAQRRAALELIRAKAAASERDYALLLAAHRPLCRALLAQ